MDIPSKPGLPGRDRTALCRARENGYLDTSRGARPDLIRAHGFWCWKLRIPLVCYAKNSPRSRFGTVRLDLFTTPHQLTPGARAELADLPGSATISHYDAVWRNVPKKDLEAVARAVYRIATRRGNYEIRPPAQLPELAKLIAAIGEAVSLRKSA